LQLLNQAEGLPRSKMVESFKQNPRSILLGADSFWQGVDVPGDALQTVIITKLPFAVPDQPLLQARLEQIRARGGNPFVEYQLPAAILKFKQGFGRLIRSQSDHGFIVVLDPRVLTKPYGEAFLQALPDCARRTVDVRGGST
jgi:ATP-dependent DNA helicase DinG